MKLPDSKQEVHLGISYPKHFPDYLIEDLIVEIKGTGIEVDVRKETLMYACMDWAIPGLIAAYLLKPYFESFLQEAGKDHYQLLKEWMKKTASRYKNLPIRTVTAPQSTEKIKPSSNTQSKAISFHIECRDNFGIKLLFDNNLSVEDWQNGIDNIMEIVKGHYLNEENNRLSIFFNKQRLRGGEIYAIIDPETKEWMFFGFDDLKLINQ